MSDEAAVPNATEEATSETRERSSIQFPYGDLNDGLAVARAINGSGGVQGSLAQLSAWMKHDSISSGAFRLKVATARIFGIVETQRQLVTLTTLGRRIIDPGQERAARVEAFLTVPLYKAVYNKYDGYRLPPSVGLENEMVALGVAAKQKDKARQAFQRSAEQAGLLAQGKDRLIIPAGLQEQVTQPPDTEPLTDEAKRRVEEEQLKRDGGDGGLPPGLHPFIQGLLESLPAPGSEWPSQGREQWLETARNIFGLIYQGQLPAHLAATSIVTEPIGPPKDEASG